MKLAALLVTVAACRAPGGATAHWDSPGIVDSHVHLALWPVDAELAEHGVLYAVDLAGPDRALAAPTPLAQVLRSGPMLTHEGGYPLDAWGADGYGFGCATEACITQRLDMLAQHGAGIVKIALDDDGLDPALLPFTVIAAHARKLKVVVHALSDASAALAGSAGADVLAHTPVERLSAPTVALWKTGAVISTLAAFGGSDLAISNLRTLRAAGATVLYGTDLGNQRDAGPSAQEVKLLKKAGLDDAAIVDAMTTTPMRFWNLAPPENTKLVLDGDPRKNVDFLLAPREVWIRGKRVH